MPQLLTTLAVEHGWDVTSLACGPTLHRRFDGGEEWLDVTECTAWYTRAQQDRPGLQANIKLGSREAIIARVTREPGR
jgi:hypothetical protein